MSDLNKDYRIGIVTFFNANNYGAVLQTFALQYFLNENNISACVVNTNWSEPEKYSSIRGIFYYFKNCKIIEKKSNNFKYFINQNFHLTKFVEREDLDSLNNVCERFIVGSDQVWNPKWNFNRNLFFLTFTNRKYSYAASFGSINENILKRSNFIKNDLSKFNSISVRENSGKDFLNTIGINSSVNIDPTFLLTTKDWEKIEISPKNINDKYVIIYSLEHNNKMLNDAKEYAKKNNYTIYQLVDSKKKKIDGIKTISCCKPEEFVYLFRNCSAVFTNSFHGTAFSIIFNKIFFSYLQNKKNAPNDRVIDLLKKFNLEQRIILNGLPNEIDYSFANNVIENERKNSLNYLQKINNGEFDSKELIKNNIHFYYCKSTDNKILKSSRSGGISTAISLEYLNNGWEAYGALLEDGVVKIKKLTNEEEVFKAANSKYVESSCLDSLHSVKESLNNGNRVFYCGLPCQIKTLYSFLKINNVDTRKLLTADIVCHGVPEQKYFSDYLSYQETKYGGKITDFNFRDKTYGWSSHVETFKIGNQKIYSRLFTKLFYSNYLLKKCCYKCPYANLNRISDITLMDSWGYTKKEDLQNGSSIVITNTILGNETIKKITSIHKEEIERLENLQPNLLNSSLEPNDMHTFKALYKTRGFQGTIKFAIADINKIERKNKIKKCLVKIKRLFKRKS